MMPDDLRPGDILLYRPTTWTGRFVAWATRSDYGHAALWTGLQVAELREFVGGRVLPIWEHAGETIDVYRTVAPTAVKIVAVLNMVEATKEKYSFLHGISTFFWLGLPKRLRPKGECNDHGLHCSQAISKAYREAGLDLCPFIPDWQTAPGDLARSPKMTCLGRLEFQRRKD